MFHLAAGESLQEAQFRLSNQGFCQESLQIGDEMFVWLKTWGGVKWDKIDGWGSFITADKDLNPQDATGPLLSIKYSFYF